MDTQDQIQISHDRLFYIVMTNTQIEQRLRAVEEAISEIQHRFTKPPVVVNWVPLLLQTAFLLVITSKVTSVYLMYPFGEVEMIFPCAE